MVRAVIIGASGRMGRCLVRAAGESSELKVSAAVTWAGSPSLGQDAGVLAGIAAVQVPVTADLPQALARADVAIDFSRGEATAASVAACRAAGKALLLGTTAWPAEVVPLLEAAAREIPLLVAANTSLAVAVLAALVETAARSLPQSFDIEVLEAHHRAKRDAPSGTAVALGRAAARGRGVPLPEAHPELRRSAARRPDEIGFAVMRGGDLAGEHTVLFAGDGEQLLLTHRATDRMVFARGAVTAALWLVRQPPGLYAMRDLLESKQ